MNENRAIILLKACRDLLNKQKDSFYVLNLLTETIFYDGADCDGYCLSDDIEDYLMEMEALKDGNMELLCNLRACNSPWGTVLRNQKLERRS